MDKNTRVGILGGIGPEATGKFYLELVRKLQNSGYISKNEDFPQIFIDSIPAPELLGNISPKDLGVYIEGLKELDRLDVDFIVIVCNTIHLYFDQLQSNVKTRILNLRELVQKELIKRNIKKIGILGTKSTVNELYKFSGIKYVVPSDSEISLLEKAIFNYNKNSNFDKKSIEKIAQSLVEKGAEAIILGCTELAIILEDTHIKKIDPMEILVSSTIKVAQKFKKSRC